MPVCLCAYFIQEKKMATGSPFRSGIFFRPQKKNVGFVERRPCMLLRNAVKKKKKGFFDQSRPECIASFLRCMHASTAVLILPCAFVFLSWIMPSNQNASFLTFNTPPPLPSKQPCFYHRRRISALFSFSPAHVQQANVLWTQTGFLSF
jgi:hypothetical protein